MNQNEAIAPLKKAMLCVQTLGEMYALIEDYSYQEFMQIYYQLPPQEQAKINAIRDRDIHRQLAAIHSAKPRSEAVVQGRAGEGKSGDWR
jgi:hypothetical protein